ncbi:MAG: SusC/RagA family TonB-linked outer membrane protein [Paraprevotella sp.]|nr:SusC/RagA family TonB-linked outer membrane protein [Paraprevotella sp.]
MKLQMLACAWCAALACGGAPAYAMRTPLDVPQQDETVSKLINGVVVDKATGESLVGVSVSLYRENKFDGGMISDIHGKFSLPRPAGKFELRVSYVGYKTIVFPAGKCKPGMKIELEEDTKKVGEVVVNGFFTKDKQLFTGAVKQISGVEIKQVSGTNLISAIAALTPGMEMVQNTTAGSNPNHTPELIIRGMSSFSNEGQAVNQPTIILDGTEISMQELYDLDMNEVESINVLKDAAATALYGSKAANGVIVITRKPIKESTLRVSYNFTGNAQFPVLRDYNVLDAMDKLQYEQLAGLYDAKGALNEATGEPLQWEYDRLYNERYQAIRRGQNSDWLSQPARRSFSHDHSLRVYGGTGNLRYELSGRYGNNKGVMKDDYRHRYNLGFKLDYYINNVLQISNRTTYSEVSSQDTPYGSFSQYTRMNPYDRMFNDDGSANLNLAWDVDNPLYDAMLGSYTQNGTHTLSNSTDFRWDISREFRLTGHFNISSETGWGETFKSPDSRMFKNETDPSKKGSMTTTSSKAVSYNGNLVGAYNKLFKDKSLLSLNAGWEINHSQSKSAITRAIGFYSDKLAFIGNASSYPDSETPFGQQSESADVGFFTNGTYSFRNRYYGDVTYRATGSSQFGENKRFGHFWATGLGWNIMNEKFMDGIRKHFDLFKLRGSVGYTGKVSFSPFQALTMYKYDGDYAYGTGIGAIPLTIGNKDLCWERTMTYNVGLDISLFDRRLNLVVDAYLKRTKDLLLDKAKAPSVGLTSARENLGELENKGIEYQIDGYIFRNRNFNWKLGTSGYINRNKITKINSALEEMNKKNEENALYAQGVAKPVPQYAEGESVTALKLVRSAGIDPAMGKEIYIKRNGEYTFDYDPADKVLIGDTEPAFTGSVSTSVYYKGFSLYALFSMRCGAWLYNITRASKVEGNDPIYNADQRVFDHRWKNPGDVAIYKDIADTSAPKQTDRFAEKENTLTLASLNLGYEFPQKICQKMHLRNLRLGINATDLFRASTVKIERGTDYLYSQGFEFTLSTTF